MGAEKCIACFDNATTSYYKPSGKTWEEMTDKEQQARAELHPVPMCNKCKELLYDPRRKQVRTKYLDDKIKKEKLAESKLTLLVTCSCGTELFDTPSVYAMVETKNGSFQKRIRCHACAKLQPNAVPFDDEDIDYCVLSYGKYKSKKIVDIVKTDVQYSEWASNNLNKREAHFFKVALKNK